MTHAGERYEVRHLAADAGIVACANYPQTCPQALAQGGIAYILCTKVVGDQTQYAAIGGIRPIMCAHCGTEQLVPQLFTTYAEAGRQVALYTAIGHGQASLIPFREDIAYLSGLLIQKPFAASGT